MYTVTEQAGRDPTIGYSTQAYDVTVTVTYNAEVEQGEPIRISGTKWHAKPEMVEPGERGSVIGVKLIDERQERWLVVRWIIAPNLRVALVIRDAGAVLP